MQALQALSERLRALGYFGPGMARDRRGRLGPETFEERTPGPEERFHPT